MNDENEFDGKNLRELAQVLSDLQAEHGFHSEAKTALGKRIDILTMSVIPEMMAEEEIDTVSYDGIGRLQTRADAWVTVLAPDREEVHKWMRENGHESMVKETIHAGTLKAWVKAQVKAGNEYPTDLIKHEAYEKAVLVKS